MLWHHQSWPAIQTLDKSLPVVIPLGSCEQHGHHLPLFVDSFQVTAIAERVEQLLPQQVLLLPTLWLGCSEHHMDFPGTVSIPASLYSDVIKRIARSILRAGFRKLLFLNGHGGNEAPGAQALTELVGEDDHADDAYLIFSSWWQVGRDGLRAERHGMTTPAISHACEYETSMMLALRPELTNRQNARMGESVLENDWVRSDVGSRVRIFRRFHRLTASGSLGNPAAATVEKGESLLSAVVEDVAEFLKDFAKWLPLPAIGPK